MLPVTSSRLRTRLGRSVAVLGVAAALWLNHGVTAIAAGQEATRSLAGNPVHVSRLHGPITIDGDISEPAWAEASRIDAWYETSPGDNTPPPFSNVGYLGFDDHYLYAAFEFDDPHPRAIRAPYGDHDHINSNTTDYGGIILDTRHDGHSAVLLLASATGIQYDAVTDDDGAGEGSSPDFFWEAKARITERGWTLELRVPFSSLRYPKTDPQTWGILLYRNRPRDFRYQYFSARLPRGGNCFICRANTLVGLEQLPSRGHIVLAPYANAVSASRLSGNPGSPLVDGGLKSDVGLDAKWTPNADNAVDFTVNPDFSQIESDTAQISANERFALSFPEKRPFFLEGVELLSTPFRAVYTRTITAPRWGTRATGKSHDVSYTLLVTEDAGGGRMVVPGPTQSDVVDQPAGALVTIGRAKRSFAHNYVGVLFTDRASRAAAGHNLVAGPDFLWRPTAADAVAGQWLVSHTRTPVRPDLLAAWTGDVLSGHAAQLQWNHNSRHLDVASTYQDIGEGFRADSGFMPQVGMRQVQASGGWTVRPQGLLSRQRFFVEYEQQNGRQGDLIERSLVTGTGMDTKLGGFLQFRYLDDRVRTGAITLPRHRFGYVVQVHPSRQVASLSIDGTVGEEIDFDNSRPARGATMNLGAQLNPGSHVELALLHNQRWISTAIDGLGRGRVFTARISRLRGTYSFNARSFARLIVQYVGTDRDPARYLDVVTDRDGSFTGSALFAYKINWQSVIFLGVGNDRELTPEHRLAPAGRQVFAKFSYAFQR